MHRSFYLLSLLLVSLAPASTYATETEAKLPPQESFHLYLLIGQSNMAGRGVIEEQDKQAHPRVLKFTKENTWAPALDPLHFDKSIAGVGLGSTFGRTMAEADPQVTIGLIPCAVGGTPLARWQKGADLYEQAVVRAKAAMKAGTLKGILWHQGEGDSGQEETAKSYGERLAKMVGDLRAELGAGEVPFVAGELGQFLRRESKEGKPSFWPVVNEQINSLPKRVPHAAVVSSEGLKHKGDEVHFDSAGLREFGTRYAAAMLRLQGKEPKKVGIHSKPNILLIVADDLGWRDVGWHGSEFQTPTLDKLVREGVELDRHYVQPVCSPTRTALMSGRWTSRWGSHVLSPTNLRAFPPGTITLASALQQCGYETHLAGKWHLGSKPEWGPNHYGFDHSYGSLNGAVDPWTHKYRKGPYEDTWHRDLQRVDEEGNATELVAKEVVQWIRQKKAPWLIYVPFHAVHIPVDAPDEYKQRYEGKKFHDDPVKNESLQRLGAMVSQLDAKVGQFLAALEETGQRENTLIVFTSDNGGKTKGGKNPYVGEVPDSPILSSNKPLRGEKATLFEGGVRVAAFANWPGKLPPGKLSAPLHAVDWMPTLTALAGWKGAETARFDGFDAWPLLTGKQQPTPRTIYIPLPRAAAVLHDGWKLIETQTPQGVRKQLFNVTADPSEERDLADQDPERVASLQQRLSELRQDDQTGLPADLQGLAP